MFRLFTNRRRRELREQPFPAEDDLYLRSVWPLYARLPEELLRDLQWTASVLLDEKIFEGAADLEVTDEMKLLIAAQAALPIVRRPEEEFYRKVRTFLIYPDEFVSRIEEHDGWVVTEEHALRSGEAWSNGTVIISWSDVLYGAEEAADGYNVVLHEMAHRLDLDSGSGDGVPIIDDRERREAWERTWREALATYRRRLRRGEQSVIDPYGAEDPAEFFAVATEAFFERPFRMGHELPELYDQLVWFYRLDPAEWRE